MNHADELFEQKLENQETCLQENECEQSVAVEDSIKDFLKKYIKKYKNDGDLVEVKGKLIDFIRKV